MSKPMDDEQIAGWIRGRLPDAWFTEPVEVTIDREEILVVGRVATPEGVDPDGDTAEVREAAAGRIARFREDTRDDRIGIAREAEHRFRRKVAWGAVCGPQREVFTNLSIPVMTRLRQPERVVLDILVEAGVARSRSDVLGWCVRLVGDNTDEWLGRLREAMTEVHRVRDEGPAGGVA
ncbi:MAG: hypothetical protein ACRDO7_08010 [Nocardioidaceae bacterium]